MSLWVLTDIHSPPAIEQAPASMPDKPLIKRVLLLRLAPAAPNTIPDTEIIPSLAPKILALITFKLSQKKLVLTFNTYVTFNLYTSSRNIKIIPFLYTYLNYINRFHYD